MIATSPNNRINSQYILVALIAVAATWVLHEFAHWVAGTLLGYEMSMTLNKAFPVKESYDSDMDYQLISAAGPVFTLIEALVVFIIMRRQKIIPLYPFLFTCFYMRLLAAGISVLNPNDEARISKAAGLGTYTLPIIMVGILFFLLYKISGRYHFSKKFNAITLGLVILFSSVIILADQSLYIRLL